MYMLIACYKNIYIYIFIFSSILKYTFIKLTNNIDIFIEFFLTNNNCVNAKFLSRYISRKLKQNYQIKELLNPIKKDLLYVIKLSIIPKKSYNKKLNKNELNYYNTKTLSKFLFKNSISFLYSSYYRLLYKFFKINNLWITLESFIFNIELNNECRFYELIKLAHFYFKRKIAYLYFFEKNNIGIYNVKMWTTKNNLKLLNNQFTLINEYLTNSNYKLFSKIIYNSIKDLNNIRFSCINFNKYQKLNYWINQIQLNSKYNIWKLNNLKSRNSNYSKANNLMGYKMYLSGRFKRKQRAAYYWFSKGRVPLNSINSIIDYGYYTIYLKNSAITVKVWLYKTSNIINTYFIKIY